MADSQDSTFAPAFSRRSLLTGAGALPFAATAPEAHASPQDPALALWREWRENRQQMTRLVRKWQRLETRLFKIAQSPRVAIQVADEDGGEEDVLLHSPEDVEQWLPDAPQAEKARLVAELEEQAKRWREAERAIGLDIADAELNAAYERQGDLMALSSETCAASLNGVAAKLAMVIQAGECGPGDEESPWPELRSILADLVSLAAPEAAALLA